MQAKLTDSNSQTIYGSIDASILSRIFHELLSDEKFLIDYYLIQTGSKHARLTKLKITSCFCVLVLKSQYFKRRTLRKCVAPLNQSKLPSTLTSSQSSSATI